MLTISAYDNKFLLSPHMTRDFTISCDLILKTPHRKANTVLIRWNIGESIIDLAKYYRKHFGEIDIGDLDKIILI